MMTKIGDEKTQTYSLSAGMKKLSQEGLETRQFCSFFQVQWRYIQCVYVRWDYWDNLHIELFVLCAPHPWVVGCLVTRWFVYQTSYSESLGFGGFFFFLLCFVFWSPSGYAILTFSNQGHVPPSLSLCVRVDAFLKLFPISSSVLN